MPAGTNFSLHRTWRRTIRLSVCIPATLAAEIRRVAKERHVSMSRAFVTLVASGVRAERDARENLKTAYRQFLKEKEPSQKDEAGRELIRTIFGKARLSKS